MTRPYANDASDALGKKWRQRIDAAMEVLDKVAEHVEEYEDQVDLRDARRLLRDFRDENEARSR